MKSKYALFILFASMSVLTSCKTTTGKGEIIEEPRHISNFNSIVLQSAADIYLSQGPWSVKVKGYENLVPILTTEVINNQLIISNENNDIIDNNNLEVFITMPELVAIEIKGAGNITTLEPMALNDLTIDLRGTSNINLHGTAQSIHCNLYGTGNIRVCEMPAEQVSTILNGTGSMYVFANQSLQAIINGTGNVNYRGNQILSQQINGVGSVTKISSCN